MGSSRCYVGEPNVGIVFNTLCFMGGMEEYYEYVCYASCFKKTVEG